MQPTIFKRTFLGLMAAGLLLAMPACQKTFLQKPSTTGTSTQETVFSTTVNALAAVTAAYRGALVQGLPYSGLGHGVLANIGGERSRGYNWHATYNIVASGLSPNPLDGNDAASSDNFATNYVNIRRAYLVLQNIDKVTDMDATNKGYIKAEMTCLVAYRYMGMFIRYGGVPIITKAQLPTDSLTIPRATLQATLDEIVSLCDTAAAGLPDKWPDVYAGRLTKGVALAIKARALLYAARPLFNSASPYLSLGAKSNLINFGSADPNRWNTAIAASEAVLTWAASNGYAIKNTGGAGVGQPNPNAFDDYGSATSTPGSNEVLLAYKVDEPGDGIPKWFNMTNYYNNFGGDKYDTDNSGMLSNFLPNYWKADGTDESWPQPGDAPRPATEYVSKIQGLEPRFLADNCAAGTAARNNLGDYNWSLEGWGRSMANQNGGYGKGDATTTKFYYHAGARLWFEFPLIRMPEIYLNLAEAYNEAGNSTKALENLNIVHNRAGLPAVTEANQSNLRKIIQREWAVEFYNEGKRYFDVKHWVLPDIGSGIIGGDTREFQFTFVPGASNQNLAASLVTYYDQVVYQTYWSTKMLLEPFPQSEVNKGIITQNPGY